MSNDEMIESQEVHTTYEISPQDEDLLKNWYYHPPIGDQPRRYKGINNITKQAVEMIMQYCPPSAERTLAVRSLQQARMWANCAIAVHEKAEVNG